jgi:hypothetical protein
MASPANEATAEARPANRSSEQVSSDTRPEASSAAEVVGMSRKAIFVVQLIWLVVLGGAAASFLKFYPEGFDALGFIPVGVLWFGAVGAALVSLTSVVDHAHDWDPSHDLWHLSRPLVGAILALMSVLMLKAGVLAIGQGVPASGAAVPKDILYYVVAFLVGYREDAFRDLMKQVVDLILRPAAKAPPGGDPARGEPSEGTAAKT